MTVIAKQTIDRDLIQLVCKAGELLANRKLLECEKHSIVRDECQIGNVR